MEETIHSREIHVAICDDEPVIRKELHKIIRRILKREEITYTLEEFDSGQQVLDEIEHIQLVFLDIEMPQLDGIEAGRQLKLKNPDCQIIIASGREDRFKETYQINALRFISKPFDEEEIREAIQAYLTQALIGMEMIEVFQNRNPSWIRQRDIQYISAYEGGIELMAKGSVYRKELSLIKLEGILDQRCFFQVHKAYIVNLFYVTDYTEKEVLVGKVRIPLSRRNRKKFESAYMDFDIQYR